MQRSNASRNAPRGQNASRTAFVSIENKPLSALRSRQDAQRERDEQFRQRAGELHGSGQIAPTGGGGEPLPQSVRRRLERSFNVNLGAVRVHSGAGTQNVAGGLSARAFTVGTDIFLGAGERADDLGLMAHEATHVVQQQGTAAVQMFGSGQSDSNEREARQASETVTRGESFTVRGRTGGPRVQRLGVGEIIDRFASNLPGFTLLTVIIGRNPITQRVVERSAVNILRGLMGLIPGGEILFQVLNNYRVVERIGRWAGEQLGALGLSYQYIRERFSTFIGSLGLRDVLNPGGVWERARNIFTEPITRIGNFVSRLISQTITWLKETFMQPLSNFCREIPGYTLVTVLLGRDPFTNVPVARSAINVVRAFAEFIPGGTEKVNQLVESGALQTAYNWFIQETQARNLTWERISGTFSQAWNSLRLEDVLHPIDTLRRMVGMFGPLMSDLVSFAGAGLMKLLELIFEAVMGAGGRRVLNILKRARETFFTIIRNPIGFLRNLLSGVGQGVRQFRTNILRHLREGVIAWLTGPVARAGIQMPERWDARGIIWFVLQILGLTWDRVRQKLVRLMGERAVGMLEAGFQLIQDIRRLGFVQALRERVTEFFGQLRESALGSIRSFIQQRLVMAGITQLVSMLNPVGAVIQAIIKTYTTINFFIQRINQILDLVESIVNSVSAIASGAIGQAANFVERTMARTIPVILDFLARFIGLGDVGGHVQRTIQGLQARVDQMLDRTVDWIRTQVQRLVAAGRSAVGAIIQWWRERRRFRSQDGEDHSLQFRGEARSAVLTIQSTERPLLEYLSENADSFGDEHRNTLRRIRTLQREIEQLRTRTVEHTSGRSETRLAQPSVDAGRQIREKLIALSVELAKLPDPRRPGQRLVMPPSRKISTDGTYPTSNPAAGLAGISRDGIDVEVKPLSIHPGPLAGSAAASSAFSLLLRKVQQRRGTYVAGHLLGSHLYGTGNSAWNLTPITVTANNNMSSREDRIQALIFNENKVLHYKVHVHYPRNATPGPKLAAEGFLPRRISFLVRTMKLKPGVSGNARALPDNWIDDRAVQISDVSSNPPLRDDLNVLTLNTSRRSDILEKAPDVARDFAQALVKRTGERAFESLADFRRRMSTAARTNILLITATPDWADEKKAQLESYLARGNNARNFIPTAQNLSLNQFVATFRNVIPDEFARFVYRIANRNDVTNLNTFRRALNAQISRTVFARYEPDQANIDENARKLVRKLNSDLTWK